MAQKKQTVIFSSGKLFIYAFFRLAIFRIGIDFCSCIFSLIHLGVFVSVFFVPDLFSCVAYHYANIRRLDLYRLNSGRFRLLSARS